MQPLEDEQELKQVLERAKTWLLDPARYEAGMIPANYRRLSRFLTGQGMLGSVAINYNLHLSTL
jgi:hypothetical protein